MQVGPELVSLGTDAVAGVFYFFDTLVDLVVDDGRWAIDDGITSYDGSQAQVSVFVVEEKFFVEEADFFQHGSGVEGGAGARPEGADI